MFEAIINSRIDLGKFNIELFMADIDTLNQTAHEDKLDVVKISFNAFADLTDKFQLLRSGAAIGFKNGPLIVSKRKIYPEELPMMDVAIPGKKTTANLLLSELFPAVKRKKVYLFSDIENAILNDEVDAGVLIHETRFSYQNRGLQLIVDLGQLWEQKKQLPLPLGGIVIRRNFDDATKKQFQWLLAQSVVYAMNNPELAHQYVKQHAQDLSDEVIQQHIALYVNKFSTWIPKLGEEAIRELLRIATKSNHGSIVEPIFVS